MGIFLCMRCATLHRKLGTHISKVKSLSMDSWSSDQVDVSEILNTREGREIEQEANGEIFLRI